jgi:hypothetical protein
MNKIISAFVLAMAAGSAGAAGYVEGTFGVANVDTDCAGTTSCKNNSTGFKLVGAFALNPEVSLELGYLSFGEGKATALGLDMTFSSTALYVGAAIRGDLGPAFTGVARVGLANVDSEVKANNGFSNKDASAQLLFGLGLEYAVQPNVRIVGAIDFTKTAEVAGQPAANLRLITGGLRVSF